MFVVYCRGRFETYPYNYYISTKSNVMYLYTIKFIYFANNYADSIML